PVQRGTTRAGGVAARGTDPAHAARPLLRVRWVRGPDERALPLAALRATAGAGRAGRDEPVPPDGRLSGAADVAVFVLRRRRHGTVLGYQARPARKGHL